MNTFNITLANTLIELEESPNKWSLQVHKQMVNGLKRLATLMRRDLSELPADEIQLAALIDGQLNCLRDGFSTEKAFKEWRSRVLRAVRETNQASMPRFTRRQQYSPVWNALFDDIEDAVARGEESKWTRKVLAHLAGYANWRGVEPCDVDSVLLEELLALHRQNKHVLNAEGLEPKDYARKAIDSARAWNKLVRAKNQKPWLDKMPATMLEWCGVKTDINPPLEAYPESFQQEVLDLLSTWAGDKLKIDDTVIPQRRRQAKLKQARENPFLADVFRPGETAKGRARKDRLSQKTLDFYRFVILQAAGACIRENIYRIDQITSLKDLCTLDAMDCMLHDYAKRQESKTGSEMRMQSASLYQIAQTLMTISKHWCSVDEETFEIMREEFRNKEKTESCGAMSVKRQQMLRQFDEPYAMAAWLMRPKELFERAEKRRKSGKPMRGQDITDVEVAILCRVLSLLPVRRKNVVGLRVCGRYPNVILPRHAKEKGWLQWQPWEVKNKRFLRSELDRDTIRMIKSYQSHYRPAYLHQHPDTQDSEFLFPGTVSSKLGDGHRDLARMGSNFSKRMKEVGLDMVLHLARHVAGKVMVEHDERNVPVVASLLGDSIETVRKFYLENRTEPAAKAYREVIMKTAPEVAGLYEDITIRIRKDQEQKQ